MVLLTVGMSWAAIVGHAETPDDGGTKGAPNSSGKATTTGKRWNSSSSKARQNVPAPMTAQQLAANRAAAASAGSYVLIGWNTLGMHCVTPSFQNMAILPLYNDVQAVLIRRGEEPQVTTDGVTLTFSIDNNSTSVGKTDFWQFAQKLYGVNLAPGVGLAGFSLSGKMDAKGGYFEATGVPITPYDDRMNWNPFQTATIVATSTQGSVLATAKSVVVPVSDELHCEKCHSDGGPGAKGIGTGNVATNILTLHDKLSGTSLMANQPVNCAQCHADNAVGSYGQRNVKNLSLAMHGKHGSLPLSRQPACYDCHPGAKTQCNRSAITGMCPVGTDPKCASCHGDLSTMAKGLAAGRSPWLQEPKCVTCHKSQVYDTGTTLYRHARGHGGLLCVTCHNSPHAWWPSKRAEDNAQPLALQGNSHAIGYNSCFVCHTDGRSGKMPPHGDD